MISILVFPHELKYIHNSSNNKSYSTPNVTHHKIVDYKSIEFHGSRHNNSLPLSMHDIDLYIYVVSNEES